MAKEATLQVRMDADLKEQVETLYRSMGTSFAEAVRIFARQSIQENGMPFIVTADKTRGKSYGRLSAYANPLLIEEEDKAYEKAMIEKHERKELAETLQDFIQEIEIDYKEVMFAALEIYAETSLDFVDCILIAHHKIFHVEVMSFDKKLNRQL